MNKDVIYIDVDDDVTAIIGKIKSAQEKVVALVPPKRAGALQSAVNLRLLDRMAKAEKKNLVLVTNNQALVALAANASIPVAKNLQSKPEIAEITALAVDDGDDIIDGGELPIGDFAKGMKINDNTRPNGLGTRDSAIESIDIDDEPVSTRAAATGAGAAAAAKKAGAVRNKIKIPNFDTFRKKLFLGIGGGVLLIALLVWAFFFAPAATVVVTARTSPSPVSASVQLTTGSTNLEKATIKSTSQQLTKDAEIEFDATGTEDVGEKATGTLRVSKLTPTEETVPAGSRFTARNGLVFITQASATIPPSQPCFPSFCAQSVNVGVVAERPGTEYNGVSGSASGPDGANGTFTQATSGGTTKMAKVVSADDIERARGALLGRSTDAEKKELTKQFKGGENVIDSSFTVERGQEAVSPTSGQEAPDGKAKLTIPTTYTMYAVAKTDLEKYLGDSLKEQLVNEDNQRVYNTGADKATFGNFKKEGDTMTATLTANGQVGPKIDETALKEQVKGKIFGDVQATLQTIEGVDDVDVRFSYFWVRTVPNNTDKIDIEFKVEDEN